MLYYVIETQTNSDGTGSVAPISTFTDLNEAKSRYHAVLSAAATSQVYKHGAIILTEDLTRVTHECFEHKEVTE